MSFHEACYLLELSYIGTRYHGWQVQKNHTTIEGELKRALKRLNPKKCRLFGASRTDAGVHAFKQLAQLHLQPRIEREEVLRVLQGYLPLDIWVKSISEYDPSKSVISRPKTKTYHYRFDNKKKTRLKIFESFTFNLEENLDFKVMQQGISYLQGTHHFERYTLKPRPSAVFERSIDLVRLHEGCPLFKEDFMQDCWSLEIRSSGFLRYMVRMLVGALINLGQHRVGLEEFKGSLSPSGNRCGFIVPAKGLILSDIKFN
jgi:tRNA pseudouridine38-40 synthase